MSHFQGKRSRTSDEFFDLCWAALRNFQEALQWMPNNCEILVNCADVILGLKQEERAG